MAGPKKNTTGKPRKVPKDIEERQDPEYKATDFARDLEKATGRLRKVLPTEQKRPREG